MIKKYWPLVIVLVIGFFIVKKKNPVKVISDLSASVLPTPPEKDKSLKGSAPINDWSDVITAAEFNDMAKNNRFEMFRIVIRTNKIAYAQVIESSMRNNTSIEHELDKAAQKIVDREKNKLIKS